MKHRASLPSQSNYQGGGAGAGLLWILVSLVLVALVFLPVVM
jgi:hypothetical protein